MAERGRVLAGERVQKPDMADRRVLVARVTGQPREAQQPERGRRAAARYRRVLQLLAARDQLLVVGRGGEEAASLRVGETVEDLLGQRARLVEPARVECRLVQRQQNA
jgi:hypothetical protein